MNERHGTAARLLAAALCLFAASLTISIAVTQIALGLAVVAWLGAGRPWRRTPVLFPIAVFCALTLVSVATSLDPVASLVGTKELLLFLIIIIVPGSVVAEPRLAGWLRLALLGGGGVSALLGVVQYARTPGGIEHLANGPVSHHLTFGGLMMLVTLVAGATVLARPSPSRRTCALLGLALLLFAAALGVSFARSAWVGVAGGLVVIAAVTRPRALPLLAILGSLAFFAAPPGIRDRAVSIVSLERNQDRLEIHAVGREIVADHPYLGVGLNQVRTVYRLRHPSGQIRTHLHNNPLQLAAERGIPAAVAWVWLMVTAAIACLRGLPHHPDRWAAAAGLGAVLALTAAGMFEYNFGDSEVAMTFLLIVALGMSWTPTVGAAARNPISGDSASA